MKKIFSFWNIIFILFIVTLAGCGGEDSAPAVQETTNTGQPESGGGLVADIPKTLTIAKTGPGTGTIVFSPSTLDIRDCATLCSGVSINGLNAWVPIATPPTVETLSERYAHTAVWTETEMIVWGGWVGDFSNTGAKYSPATNQWTQIAIPPSDVISARDRHSAVWTGTEMIIWGGREGSSGSSTEAVGDQGSNTGAKYNPATDTWTTITPPPPSILEARMGHTAVWTGLEMIIWGGFEFGPNAPVNTGAKYNPATDTWTPILTPPPLLFFTGRERHSAVWTGTEMIIWGGLGDAPIGFPPTNNFPTSDTFNNGAKYNPTSNIWRTIATPPSNIMGKRRLHSAAWNGTEMIIWGGFELGAVEVKTGAKYNPATDTSPSLWEPILAPSSFSERGWHSAVWTGTEMLLWGGVDRLNQLFNDGSGFRGGELITLTATADPGSMFDRWSGFGPCEIITGPCEINVDGDQFITATFIEVP
ncbi:MAG: hypothetical protein ABGX83_06520 [Nitrospira sp.]|nr:hypothetical protein [Candidatus Manganitrophaceae bacterium]HIL34395.1 hypothetical protein [Candidatus Manganitrophaceae bacterium]